MDAKVLLGKFPPLFKAAVATKARLQWLRWRMARRPIPDDAEMRLHLGCGDIDYPGFVNVDARPAPHVHYVQTVDRLTAFKDSSVSLVYSSHCLEHVSHRNVSGVLAEWRRVLVPGGIMRISVPDFDLLVDAYLSSGRDLDCVQLPLMGAQDYPFNFHFTSFTRRTLTDLLHRAGFEQVRPWIHGSDFYTALPDWSGRSFSYKGVTYPVSLNLEAVK
jgi:predicted SAM-dependent methyltransferase